MSGLVVDNVDADAAFAAPVLVLTAALALVVGAVETVIGAAVLVGAVLLLLVAASGVVRCRSSSCCVTEGTLDVRTNGARVDGDVYVTAGVGLCW